MLCKVNTYLKVILHEPIFKWEKSLSLEQVKTVFKLACCRTLCLYRWKTLDFEFLLMGCIPWCIPWITGCGMKRLMTRDLRPATRDLRFRPAVWATWNFYKYGNSFTLCTWYLNANDRSLYDLSAKRNKLQCVANLSGCEKFECIRAHQGRHFDWHFATFFVEMLNSSNIFWHFLLRT